MQRLWFISNIRSGSATQAGCEAIEAVCAEKGLALAGRTRFPDDPLPDPAELAAARVTNGRNVIDVDAETQRRLQGSVHTRS